jgi:hypothetical protein
VQIVIAQGYVPHSHQVRFHNSGKRFVVAAAGVRGGKTYSAVVEFLRRIYLDYAEGRRRESQGTGKRRRPAQHYWAVSPTAALGREVQRYIHQVVPRELIELDLPSEAALWLKPNILIEFKSADAPQNLVASGLMGVLVDEACRVKRDAWIGQLRSRLSDYKGFGLFSTSPLGKTNWVYEELVSKAGSEPEYDAISWRTVDNPVIDPAEVEAARRQLPLAYFKRDYEADWSSFGGSIFAEFDEAVHVVSEAQLKLEYGLGARPITALFRRVVAGFDFGDVSPGAIVVIGDMGRGQGVILEESYAPGRIFYEPRDEKNTWVGEAKRLKKDWGVSQFFCDTEDRGKIRDLSRLGVPANGADKQVLYGIRKLAEGFHPVDGRPRLRVLNTCKNFIRETKGYQWDQDRMGGFIEYPAPNQSDHAIDSARYAWIEIARYATDEAPKVAGRPIY